MLTRLKLSPIIERPASRALVMGTVASIAGAAVFVVSASTMIILWARLLYHAMGLLGFVLGLLTAPIASAYPLIHWAAHSEFHLAIFGVWLAGLIGLSVTVVWVAWGRHRVIHGETPATPAHLATVIAIPQDSASRD